MTTINTWKRVKDSLVTWQDRANSHIELRNISDRTLRDIGLTRGNEGCYSASPFWVRSLI
jgi:uncharacterized protein YjiS (DUF1127 family)